MYFQHFLKMQHATSTTFLVLLFKTQTINLISLLNEEARQALRPVLLVTTHLDMVSFTLFCCLCSFVGLSFVHSFIHSRLGNYIYAEASSPRNKGNRARMTQYLFLRHKACLFFHYHMYGADMGTLKVYISNRLVWKLHGNQGNQWVKATIPLQKAGFYRVCFINMTIIFDIYHCYERLSKLPYSLF